MDPTSDNALMEQVRDGQVARLAILFERHHVVLYNFFLRLTGRRGPERGPRPGGFCPDPQVSGRHYRSESRLHGLAVPDRQERPRRSPAETEAARLPIEEQFEEPAGDRAAALPEAGGRGRCRPAEAGRSTGFPSEKGRSSSSAGMRT